MGYDQSTSSSPRRRKSAAYPARIIGGLGISQVFLGLMMMGLQITAICTAEPMSFLAAGLWGGALFLLAGSSAIVSTKQHRKICWILTVMIVSILAAVVALIVLALAAVGLHMSATTASYKQKYPLTSKTLDSLLVVAALAEAVISTLTSVLACKGVAGFSYPPAPMPLRPPRVILYVPKGHPELEGLPRAVEMRPLMKSGRSSSSQPSDTLYVPIITTSGRRPTTGTSSPDVQSEFDSEPPPAYTEH